MSFQSAFLQAEAAYASKVMFETWGHLYPPLGSQRRGLIEFVVGLPGECCRLVNYSFEGLSDSPVLHDDCDDFVFDSLYDKCEVRGLYQWRGEYRKCKNEKALFLKGKLKLVYEFKNFESVVIPPALRISAEVAASRGTASI